MKNIHIVFSTIVSEKWDFFTESLAINQEMSLDEMKVEVNKLIDSFNRVEVSRYGSDVFQRQVKEIIGYIPMKSSDEKYPTSYGKYKSFSEVPDCVLSYCSENFKTLSAYLVKKFDLNEEVLVVM